MIKTFIIGIFVGLANVIPGVSGGTLIVVFNIYDKFIDVISFNVKKLIKNWRFVVPILAGLIFGILIFSKGIKILFDNFPTQTNFFFTGLIIGSIPLLLNYTFKNTDDTKFSSIKIIGLSFAILAGFLLMLILGNVQNNVSSPTSLQTLPHLNFFLCLKLFIGGILGAFAMIIPGISGSLLLLILGIYPLIINAISGLLTSSSFLSSVCILLPVGIGIIVGIFAGAKLIRSLLSRVPHYTYAVILGLIVGSAITLLLMNFDGFAMHSVLLKIFDFVLLALGFSLAFFSTKNVKE